MDEIEFKAHPRMLRRQATIWTVVMGGAALYGWFMLPASIRNMFTVLQIATLIMFIAILLGIVWILALGWVKAGPAGLAFRNGLRTHQVPWSDVENIRFRLSDHWAFVDLNDDTDKPLLGIQRSDGRHAEEAVAELRKVAAKYVKPAV